MRKRRKEVRTTNQEDRNPDSETARPIGAHRYLHSRIPCQSRALAGH
ncbi:hypothetical protein ALC53_10392 [Atta colombica]|uniref:Uncharacterized protein n=1 Tax=Atta colombica TaxID=520822 RepID=A0A195B415_9HYME|nr:hypothetical protein ALC53_10392 [Atta colombica]